MPLAPSVSTVVLDGHAFARGLDLLAQAGAKVVEPAFIEGYMPFDETMFTEGRGRDLARAVATAGLTLRALSVHTDLGQPDSADKLLRRLGFAAAAGARIVISNATTADRADALFRTLETVAPTLDHHDLTLALENPGHGHNALLPSGAAGASVIAAVGHPRIRMNYDIGNAASYGARRGSVVEDLAAVLPVTAHVHLKDFRAVGSDWQFCPLGEGDVGYGTAVPLDRLPEGLPLGVEHPLRLWRPGRGDPVRASQVPEEAHVISAVMASLRFLAVAGGHKPKA